MSEVRSMRGAIINFDLIRIQQSLSDTPPPQVVVERQMAIEERIQRRRILRQQKANEKRLLDEAAIVDETDGELDDPQVEDTVAPRQSRRKTLSSKPVDGDTPNE